MPSPRCSLPIRCPTQGTFAATCVRTCSRYRQVLSEPRSRQVIGALVSEGASDELLSAALRERVSEPRRRELEARFRTNESMANVPIDTAVDQLVGPIYYRTVIIHSAVDDRLVDAVLDALLTPNDHATAE